MPAESPTFASVPARRQFENIGTKHTAFSRTIQQLTQMPGLSSSIVDRAEELNREMAEVYRKAKDRWHQLEQPLNAVNAEMAALEQRAREARNRLEEAQRQVEANQVVVQKHRESAQASPENGRLQEKLKQHEQQLQTLMVGVTAAQSGVRAAEDNIANLRPRQQSEQKRVDDVANAPLAELDSARQQAERLVESANRLYEEATKERSVATNQLVDSNIRTS